MPGVVLASLADVAVLASDNRDLRLKDAVEHLMRPVKFEQGRIEVTLLPNAPRDLAGDLGRKLSEWTGERWLVIVARDGGGATIGEEVAEKKRQRTDDARADPQVAAVLNAFPGAKIVDVRIFEPDEAELDAAALLDLPDDDED